MTTSSLWLAEAIPGISDLPGYGIVGVLMAIIVGGAVVIITVLWRALSKEQTKRESLETLIREKYVTGLESAFHATTEAHDLITILRDELRQRPR